MSELDHDDNWLGSSADDEVVREVFAEENVIEKENIEPSTTDDPIVICMSLLDKEEDD